MLPAYFPEIVPTEISKLFGQEFAESLFELESQVWHGPVVSGYGVHLVYVHNLEEWPLPVFAEVEERVKKDWTDETRRELQEKYIDEILSSYEIVFEDLPEGSEVVEDETGTEISE